MPFRAEMPARRARPAVPLAPIGPAIAAVITVVIAAAATFNQDGRARDGRLRHDRWSRLGGNYQSRRHHQAEKYLHFSSFRRSPEARGAVDFKAFPASSAVPWSKHRVRCLTGLHAL
jgi:hypothetical protein